MKKRDRNSSFANGFLRRKDHGSYANSASIEQVGSHLLRNACLPDVDIWARARLRPFQCQLLGYGCWDMAPVMALTCNSATFPWRIALTHGAAAPLRYCLVLSRSFMRTVYIRLLFVCVCVWGWRGWLNGGACWKLSQSHTYCTFRAVWPSQTLLCNGTQGYPHPPQPFSPPCCLPFEHGDRSLRCFSKAIRVWQSVWMVNFEV